MSSPLLRLLRRMLGPAGPRMALATLLGVLGGGATVGLLAGSGAVVAKAAFRPGLGAIAGLLAAVEVMAFLRGPLRYGERLVGHDATLRVLARWRVWLYDRLVPLSPAGLRAWRSGDLLSRAVDDVDQLQDLYLRGLTPLVVALTTAALALGVVGFLLPLGALVLGVALVVALVVPTALALVLQRAQGREADLRGAMSADVVDLFQGSAELLAFGRHEEMLERVTAADRRLARAAGRRALAAGLTSSVVTACLGGAVVGVVLLAAAAVHGHQLEPIMAAVLPLTAMAAFETVLPVALAVLRLREATAAGHRLLEVDEVPVPVIDPAGVEGVTGPVDPALERVALRYGEGLPRALDGVDLELEAGEKVAITGRSGAGKTSLVHALLRYWPLESGTYRLGGRRVEELRTDDVRAVFGLLQQDADLFSGSIRDNIVLGRQVDPNDLERAVSVSQLSDWLGSLPAGLDTDVGEHGAAVSGGQRQRVAMARTLLAAPAVLLLDEPTSGLDDATADGLLGDLLAAFEGHRVLLVTHGEHDLAGWDRVLEMHDGRLLGDERDGGQ